MLAIPLLISLSEQQLPRTQSSEKRTERECWSDDQRAGPWNHSGKSGWEPKTKLIWGNSVSAAIEKQNTKQNTPQTHRWVPLNQKWRQNAVTDSFCPDSKRPNTHKCPLCVAIYHWRRVCEQSDCVITRSKNYRNLYNQAFNSDRIRFVSSQLIYSCLHPLENLLCNLACENDQEYSIFPNMLPLIFPQ